MAPAILSSTQNDLPTELVLVIIDHLSNDIESLCTLARTSRALQQLAEEHIYKNIELTTVLGLHAIIQAFTYRHERVRAVHTLKLQYHHSIKELDDNMDMRTTFNECVAHMVNLREWHIESPYDNSGHWEHGQGPQDWVRRDMERFQVALATACIDGPAEAQRIQAERALGKASDRTVGLALLERLTIHSHGVETDFWDLGSFHCLFRHPSLRHIHISCVSFTESIPALHSHIGKTPLTSLVFDECELSPASLRDILRTPTKLKHLTLGENVWNTRRSRHIQPRLTKDASGALDALSAVAHSLESLTHFDPTWKLAIDSYKASRMSRIGDGMRNFHSLKYLECELTSFLHQAIIMNHETAPPNLQTLRLRRHWYVSVDFFDRPPEVETYLALPSLSTLELMQSSHCWLELSQPEYICEEQRVRSRHAYAYKLYKAGINLKVLIEMHRDDRIIPPYLYGEALPIVECLYDAQDTGFHRHIINELHIDMNEILSDTQRAIEQPNAENTGTHQDWVQRMSKINNHESAAATRDQEPPETDQLGDIDVAFLAGETESLIDELRDCFIRRRQLRRAESILEFIDDDDNDGDLSEDGEFDIETDEYEDDEDDMEIDEDDLGVIFHEQNGELYVEVYESESEEEEDADAEQAALNAELD